MNGYGMRLRTALAPLVLAGVASAHPGEPPAPHDLWSAWNLSPFTLPTLLLVGFLYWRGYTRLRRAGARPGLRNRAVVQPWQALCFLWGLLALNVALVSPLDALGSSLLSAHMAQHIILLVVAPPLLVLASPGYVLPWAFPLGTRRRVAGWWHGGDVGRLTGPISRALFTPLAASLLYAAVVWVWHAPGLYQAALTVETVHVLEHLTFLGGAYLFWWLLLAPLGRWRTHHGVGVATLFFASVQGSALGALMAFSPTVWYPAYEVTAPSWGTTALADQQLAGLIMWMPVGTVYVLLACAFLWRWLRSADLAESSAPPHPAQARLGGG